MYDRILVPTDGSAVANRAGTLAVEMAARFDAELHVIHVRPRGRAGRSEALDSIETIAVETGLDPVTAFVDSEGSIHRAILDYVVDHDVDAVVMGTEGRSGVGRYLLGSVAVKTLQNARIPVVTVHEGTDVAFDVDRILVPTDGSEGADAAVDHAIGLCRLTDAALHVLHVVGGEGEAGDWLLEAVAGRAEEAGVDRVETVTRRGRPHVEIASYSTEEEIDVTVMGTHGRSGFRRYMLGSVTERTVRFSTVPVVAVKPVVDVATVTYLDYEVLEEHGWSPTDEDLMQLASDADLPAEAYGTMEVPKDEYILDAAEANGHDWPFHCRVGACVNCAAILVDGEVEMDRYRALRDEEVEERNLRVTCVGKPATGEVALVYNAKELDVLSNRVF